MQPAACPPNLACTSELAAGMWETAETRGTGCSDSSTMATFKMSHTRVHCKDNTATICITERPPRSRHFTPLFSVWGMSGILACPFDCKKRRAPFLKKQRGILGVGSDGQAPFPLMLFLPSVFSHERRHCEKFGCCSNGATCVGSLTIWLIIRPFCTAETKKEDTELIAKEKKKETVVKN